jgi:D-threo-aldose 1-dehydrogenase
MPTAKQTVLPRSQLPVSRIGLGLAHLQLMTAPERQRLIERALELGITHFDTARFYGDGLSERTLAQTLGARRKQVTIATKFGLLPTPLIGSLDGRAAWAARKARSLLHKLHIHAYPQRSYTRQTMERALAQSLRALGSDYVDIYHVHEPLADTRLSDELLEALQRGKRSGAVRLIGVSGADIDAVVARYGSALDVLQSAEHAWSEARFVPDITHSLFTPALQRSAAALSAGAVSELLVRALERRREGAVIVQTRDPDRLTQLVEAAGTR